MWNAGHRGCAGFSSGLERASGWIMDAPGWTYFYPGVRFVSYTRPGLKRLSHNSQPPFNLDERPGLKPGATQDEVPLTGDYAG